MPGRTTPIQTAADLTSAGTKPYRYGFNGKENDFEVKNIGGSSYDFGARIYDPRLARFLSVDPLASKYPYLSSYLFAENTPIMAIDLDGLDKFEVTIIPNRDNPKLTLVTVNKVAICNETVVSYIHRDPQGAYAFSERATDRFKEGSVENYYMNQQFGSTGKTNMQAMNATRIVSGAYENREPLHDMVEGGRLVEVNLFQYDLKVNFANNSATLPSNEQTNNDINDFNRTMQNPITYKNGAGETQTADLKNYAMKVNGETDSNPSNYKGVGNSRLGQDRANNLLTKLQSFHPNFNSTGVIQHEGTVKAEDRKATIFITPKP